MRGEQDIAINRQRRHQPPPAKKRPWLGNEMMMTLLEATGNVRRGTGRLSYNLRQVCDGRGDYKMTATDHRGRRLETPTSECTQHLFLWLVQLGRCGKAADAVSRASCRDTSAVSCLYCGLSNS